MSAKNNGTMVLVTGVSGYIGGHCAQRLLAEGYQVRGTIRSMAKADAARKPLVDGDPSAASRLSFVVLDLMKDEGWEEAASGCDYILHVASPFPFDNPKNEDELIRPAVDGTLRALKAAVAAHVKRVVVTSSMAAIVYGHKDYSQVMDETTWSEVNNISGYEKSKTLAERAAWDFIRQHPELELVVINPSAVFGPLLPGCRDIGSTVGIVQRIITGGVPAAPRVSVPCVDVRDVAKMHVRAMTLPEAAGQRFTAISGPAPWMSELGGPVDCRIRKLPNWVARLASPLSADLARITPLLGIEMLLSNEKSRRVLGIDFIPWERSIKDTADSLRRENLVK